MKAVVLVQLGNPHTAFEIREVSNPQLTTLDVLIQVEAFGLNFADVMARNGLYRDAPPLPSVLGYDVVGRVIESGGYEGKHLIGKRVVAMTRFGGYAELAKTDYRACAEIPEEWSATMATALATQYCTAYYAAFECANLHKGDHILIHAAGGGVGTALTQMAKSAGCIVFGTTSSDTKFDYLKQQGVDHPINYITKDYEKEIEQLIGQQKIDIAFNSVGGSTFKKDLRLLNKGGKSVVYGAAERSGKKGGIFATLQLAWNFGIQSPIPLLVNSQGIIGVNMLRIADYKQNLLQHCLTQVVRMTKNEELSPQEGGTFAVNEIGKAHEYLQSRKSTGKIAVRW
jgi:NADPH:quinone reductase-like Zn-dependent oxidoreductase